MSLDHIPGLTPSASKVGHVASTRLRRVRHSSWWSLLLAFLVGVIVGQAAEAVYPLDNLIQLAAQLRRIWQ